MSKHGSGAGRNGFFLRHCHIGFFRRIFLLLISQTPHISHLSSGRLYQALFHKLPFAALLAADGIVLEANTRAGTLFGCAASALADRPVASLLTGMSAATATAPAQQDGQQIRLQRPDGRSLPVHVDVYPLLPEEPSLLCYEIYPDAAAATAPALSSDPIMRLPALLDEIKWMALFFDAQGQVQHVSRHLVKLSGFSEEALRQQPDFIALVERERSILHDSLKEEPGTAFRLINEELEHDLHTASGEIRSLKLNRTLLRNAAGEGTGMLTTGQDITEARHVIEHLQNRKTELLDLIDNAHDFILQIDLEGRFQFANRSLLRQMGYTWDELSGTPISDVVHPDYRRHLHDQLTALVEGQAIDDVDTVFNTKNGEQIHLHGSFTLHMQEGKPSGTRAILHDLTDRNKAEQIQRVYYRIANLAISTHDLPELYRQIHIELSRLMDTGNIYIALCDERQLELEFVYFVDAQRSASPVTLKRPFEAGLTEYIIRTGEPLFAQRQDLEELALIDVRPKGTLPEVFIGTPLRLGNQIRGVIALQNYFQPNAFQDSDLRLLNFISSQIALAIERKRNEEQIRQQTARMRSIFESSSHLIWSVSRNLKLTSFNQNYARAIYAQYGVLPEINLDPNQPRQLFADTAYHKFWEEKYDLVFQGIPQQFTTCLTDLEGKQIWRQIYLNPIYLEDGTFEEVAGISHEITEIKKAEQAIQKSEEEFRAIFESFQDVYYRTDLEGYLTLISPSSKELIGYTQEEAIGLHASALYFSVADRERLLKLVYKHGRINNFETTLIRKDGSSVQVVLNSHLLIDKDGQVQGLEGVVKDITDLKKTQVALIKAKEDAENSLKVKAQFLANMSHELRTPMNGIIGMIDLLSQTNPNDEQKDYLDTLRRSSDVLLHILNDILDLSKIQAGKLQLNETQLDLHYVMDKIYSLFLNRAYQKNINLTYHIADEAPHYIFTDETRLLQILSNLTSNAIKFTNNGEVHIEVTVKAVNQQEYTLLFEVRDTGIGIEEGHKALLFTNFTQLDNSSTKSFSGTGLGLAISKQLCELLGGEIGMDSAPERGSTFWFTIRCLAATRPEATLLDQLSAEALPSYYFNSHPRVLLVDDNQINQKVAEKLLGKIGCEVDVAANGFEAIDKALSRKFNFIFMDIQMPEMDGIAATQHIKRLLGKNCPPIVAMTAYSMKDDAEKFIEQGLDDYIAKPVKAIDLYHMIKKWTPAPEEHIPAPAAAAQAPAAVQHDAQEPSVEPDVLDQLRQLGGEEFARQLYDDFATEGTELLSGIQKEPLGTDNAQILAKLHQLKGTAGTLGIQQVALQAKKIEHNLKQHDEQSAAADLQVLYRHFEHFKATYHSFFEA